MTKKPKLICLLSCLHDVRDSHTKHYLRTLVRGGYAVLTIRPGRLDAELERLGCVHCALDSIDHHFWPEGTPLRGIVGALAQRLRNTFVALRHLWRHRPEVVMAMEPDSVLLAVVTKPMLRHRVVADLREIYEDRLQAFPRWTHRLLRPAFRGVFWLLSAGVDEIIHVSEERRQQHSYLALPGVVVVYYPDVAPDVPDDDPGPELPSGVVALHAGPLRHSYAACEMLAAVRQVVARGVDLKLVVLGGTLQALVCHELLDELVAAGRVILVPSVPSALVPAFMRKASFGLNLVLPVDRTHYLAQPRKLYEYLHSGLPVVGSNVPTIANVLKGANCGLVVDPSNVADIADAMQALALDDGLRKRLAQNARLAARERYTWSGQEPAFFGIFQRLTADALGPQGSRATI